MPDRRRLNVDRAAARRKGSTSGGAPGSATPARGFSPRAAAPPATSSGATEPLTNQQLGRLMLPLRVFLGVTFVYAGLVKLLDPSFLDPAAPGSMVAQLHAFARTSPLAPLIDAVGIPLATPIGLLIAVGELGVGIGALTGLAARLAAWGGFAISMLFFLTASWGTSPYFYGPDLPYAFGWLTLALVGDRGVFVARGSLASALHRRGTSMDSWSPERRTFLEALLVGTGALTLAVIGLARPQVLADLLGATGPTVPSPDAPGVSPSPAPSDAQPSAPSPTSAADAPPTVRPSSTAAAVGPAIATTASVATDGSASFVIPATGDPGVVLQLANGTYVAFDAVCTHAGCPVEYVPADQALECPCHGAAFDPARHGAVIVGPARRPLASLPIVVDHRTGQIYLTA
jgi:thiosulfate dehydrogenase [quinone] large subunit